MQQNNNMDVFIPYERKIFIASTLCLEKVTP